MSERLGGTGGGAPSARQKNSAGAASQFSQLLFDIVTCGVVAAGAHRSG